MPFPFEIDISQTNGLTAAVILPDLAPCTDCLRELSDPNDRRFRHPFISCTRCGPRFSIVTGIPYDRPRTTLAGFPLCPDCQREYEDPGNRRFHAQPICCPRCGPRLSWHDRTIAREGDDVSIDTATATLRQGGIVAVKGVGGFHLLCDARNEMTVRRLRERKGRQAKPFALLVTDIEMAQTLAELGPLEVELLHSPARPIVLARRHERLTGLAPSVAPGHADLGLMLPYSPLHALLLAACDLPLVATSGNRGEEPICTTETDALDRLGDIADGFLLHDRPIARPVEDSVVRIAAGRTLMIRRARGYAPEPLPAPDVRRTILALGGQWKTTITLLHRDRAVVSSHLGDLDHPESREALRAAVRDLPQLLDAVPDEWAVDLHPDFATTRLAQDSGKPFREIQHHVAHIMAVLGEHHMDEPALGVAWDGFGYGSDGQAWGGEFITVSGAQWKRIAHLRPFPLPGGDAATREPRRSALGLLHESGRETERARDWFSEVEWTLLSHALQSPGHMMRTSSVGRLFDAVAALLGVCLHSRYEGEAAMRLESVARTATPDDGYSFQLKDGALDWMPMLCALHTDLDCATPVPVIAARFHEGLAQSIVNVAKSVGLRSVVLSGGCFQNVLLLERSIEELKRAGFEPLWPRNLPPGDGALSYGQAIAAARSGFP